MKTGVLLIAEEREHQISKHGFTGEHHANNPLWYDENQLIRAAWGLCNYDKDQLTAIYRDTKPLNWDKEWWQRMCDKPKLERLIIAGALIAAEIDRLQSLTPEANFFATEKTNEGFNPNKKTGEL